MASNHPHAHPAQSATPKYITIIASAGALGPIPNSEPSGIVAPKVTHRFVKPHVALRKPTARYAATPTKTVALRKPHAMRSTDSYLVGETLWQTWKTDPSAYKPTLSDPTRSLPLSAQETFACIRYVESRNHPNDTNQSSGAEGLYQFLPYIWRYGAKALGIPVTDANYATPEQQSAVAVWYYKRNNGFAPEWQDGCAGE